MASRFSREEAYMIEVELDKQLEKAMITLERQQRRINIMLYQMELIKAERQRSKSVK